MRDPDAATAKRAPEIPPERVRENVSAQLKVFDGYNARPISGAQKLKANLSC